MIFVVVVYNKLLSDIKSLNTIEKHDVIIFDNSTLQEVRKKNSELSNNKYIYLSDNKNVGLSKAYNKAIKYIKINFSCDYVIFLDDDTLIKKSYVEELEKVCRLSKYDIIVPKIYGFDKIMYSPNKFGILKNHKLKDSELNEKYLNNKNFNAINSCLCIRYKFIENYKYNEKLFLDQVDQNFFKSIFKTNFSFHILNQEILQNFSQREKKYKLEYLSRFKIRCKDLKQYYIINYKLSFILYTIKILLLSFIEVKKTKSIKYLTEGLQIIFKE